MRTWELIGAAKISGKISGTIARFLTILFVLFSLILVAGTAAAGAVSVANGKIQVNGADFLVKGVDYTPWLIGTGPDPTRHQPFPSQYEDVTAKVNNAGIITVKDYDSDGKIQTWEVVQYDMETIKSTGANTIRTYASGNWHDKNLNGVFDADESVQGDLPDWAIDRILNYASANNMKVIMGYWVQEEDFKAGLQCNFDDLAVAKQAFGRIVTKYKNNDAVLAWAVGNEVHGSWNSQWFTWTVDINNYLNQLNSYVKTLDTSHPIIYTKYVGENANFGNLNADIMAVNSFTNPAPLLASQCNSGNPIPSGKACIYGEFGHDITQATGHWNDAKNYAGGCFLEYSDVWWKTGPVFGIVNQYREKVPSRYNVLFSLFGGNIACNANSDCGTDSWVNSPYCSSGNVYQNYKTFTCNNPGTTSASCSSATSGKLKQTCTNGCSNGACIAEDYIFYEPFESMDSIAANNGTAIGTVYFESQANANCGNAANFAESSYALYPLAGNFPIPGEDATIEFWVKADNRTKHGFFDIGRLWGTNPNSMGIFHNYDSIYSEVRNASGPMTQVSVWNFTKEQWNHVAIILDYYSANCLYLKTCLNDKPCAQESMCNFNPDLTKDMWVGRNYAYGNSYSYMDEFRIFNRARTAQEIASDYLRMMSCTGQAPPTPPTSAKATVTVVVNPATMFDISQVKLKLFMKDGSVKIFSKYGNQFKNITGAYVSASHCSGSQCSWIAGNQIVLGKYTKPAWANANWVLNLGNISQSDVSSARVVVNWPVSPNKGIHNTQTTGSSAIRVNGNRVWRNPTNVMRCGAANDWFAHSCSVSAIGADVPLNYIFS